MIFYLSAASKCWLMLAADQECTWDEVRESGRIRCGNKQYSWCIRNYDKSGVGEVHGDWMVSGSLGGGGGAMA